MNREGVGLELSPEWLQGTATGFLFLLAAWWAVALLARAWREVLWREGQDAIERAAQAVGGPIRPSRAGWEANGPVGVVRIRGGVLGVRARLTRPDGARRTVSGWPTEADLAFLRDPA